ncbi:MAG: ATP-binding protein [Acidobacteriota bacterium]
MNQSAKKLPASKILSTLSREDFIGRNSELDALILHATNENQNHGLLLLSAPALGVSELLKQTYDLLFSKQTDVIPVYFALEKSDKTAAQAALRFLQTFLQQSVAFHRWNAKILNASPDVCELSELALPFDGYWIDRLIEICEKESKLNNDRAFINNCLSAPLRALANGARAFVIIDNLHEAENFSDETNFTEEIREIFSRSDIRFVFAGKRRYLFNKMLTLNADVVKLKPLSFSEAGILTENLAQRYSVKINEQTRDLIAAQLDGNPTFIKFLLTAAQKVRVPLNNFQKVKKIYTAELFGGKIGKFYDNIFNEIAPDIETQKNLLRLLCDVLTLDAGKSPIESWRRRTNLSEIYFYQTMRLLNMHEIVRITSNLVEPMFENQILTDYVKSRFRLEITVEPRALVIGRMLSEFIKRAPQTMARWYRRRSTINLRELLSVFDSQETPESLFDYSVFKDKLKGLSDDEIVKISCGETKKIRLPQISYATHSAAFYPQIAQVTEKERSAVAFGFQNCNYTDDDEIAWIAAEIDSKLEASKELTEFWCDRLEMVALMCNFQKYKIWLVSPEGFSPEATEVLRQRDAYGSSRRQVELLIKYLDPEETGGERQKANEYEIIVPMGDETELIAAHAVEEIARRHHFNPKAINQIKTALVEAYINATEHSQSPDRKIYQKFTVEDDKIVIVISNRSLRLSDKKAREIKTDEGRRGWGLKLMQNLMDEVKFEQVDDGTRISMIKYLKPQNS